MIHEIISVLMLAKLTVTKQLLVAEVLWRNTKQLWVQ